MKSNIKRIRICWVNCSKLYKNSVYVVYNNDTTRTYLFDSLLDIPTTVLNYYKECMESNKCRFVGQSFNNTTGSVRTFIIYDKSFDERR